MNKDSGEKSPTRFNDPQRKTLDQTDVGDVGMAVLTLTRELCVLNDRVRVLEAVLAKKGIDVQDEINNFQPDEVLQKELNDQGQMLVKKVLEALSGT